MRVVVALEHHFFQSPDGAVYPHSVCDYVFFSRYLAVFDEVVVFARIKKVDGPPRQVSKSSGPGVRFLAVPDFLGPWQYLKLRNKLVALAGHALGPTDACILRVPGQMGTLLWRQAMKAKRPYGVEVVGDPWESLDPQGIKSFFCPIARRKARWELAQQCRHACAASYVTKDTLQRRYPTAAWSVYYSSIELPGESIIDESAIRKRIERIETRHRNNEIWRICYVGTMAQLYKGPDILISAVADCIKKGIKLELVMLGEGRFRSKLESQVQDLGISRYVKFLGQLPAGQAVYAQLDNADLFILPSLTEGLPRSLIEAMARGLPCIATNVGGLAELMEQGFMVQPDDVEALSEKIATVVSDVGLMKEMVKRNVQVARQYRSDVLQERRNEFYTKVNDATIAWSMGQTAHKSNSI